MHRLVGGLRVHRPPALPQVFEVQVFPQGDRVVSIGADGVAIVWNVTSGEALQRLEQRAPAGEDVYHRVRVFPDGGRVVTAVQVRDSRVGSMAVVWDVATGRALRSLTQRLGPIRFLEVSPDAATVVTVARRTASMWDAASGEVSDQHMDHAGLITGAPRRIG